MRIVQVDAFTSEPFCGNPAAVCLLDTPRPEVWMQDVAREMNLSETAFVRPVADGFSLRWFTPTVEVDLCGHATLATAHVLWEDDVTPDPTITFASRSGPLGAARAGDWIDLDFPARPARPCDVPPGLADALGAEPVSVGLADTGYLVELADEAIVRDLSPDFVRLGRLDTSVIVTAEAASEGYDFVSRYFAPGYGIDEDPVTGSAHCTLGPFWADRLGRDELVGRQVSARGGVVRVRPEGHRVALGGQAVTVLRGELV